MLSLDLPTTVVERFLLWEHREELGGWHLNEAIIPADVVNEHGPPTVVEWDVSWEALRLFTPIEWEPALKAFRPLPE